MTPFRNDQENPFARERDWPAMPQAPLRLARTRAVLGMGVAEPDIDALQAADDAPHRRRRPRLTPLIGAAAVGVGGLLTLFLLIGLGPAQP
jgi:hypothetical protein